ncbi:MAG: acyltransferase [Candidatus Eremiobacteraeota bacterium]|nr:acyltransferase [Candidatus Eremiobacteraeota bacterium]
MQLIGSLRRLRRGLRLVAYDALWGKREGRVSLEGGIRYDPDMRLVLERGVWLSRNGSFQGAGSVRIGAGTYIGSSFSIHCVGHVAVGRKCLFGNNVSLVDNDHGIAVGRPMLDQPLLAAPIRVGDDCWLGEKATVLKGVTIGAGAVVAAGALVRADVPPGAIVAGVPARLVRMRDGSPLPG